VDNPNFLARRAFELLEQAEGIVNKAVFGVRALTPEESTLVEVLKAQAAPMLARATEMQEAVQAGR
jgi:hypothetical protein